jgi:ribosomal protein RSM22 (predicted rRNA methylase)
MNERDWCHRTVRVERSAWHRALKLADLAFEDEKFSYVAMTRARPSHQAGARIVRRPIRAGGHVHLDLCSQAGLTRTTVARSARTLYKAARDAEWGDAWPPP